MQDIRLLNTVYEDVPAVELPKEGGGTARFDDTSDANATASDIVSGKTAYVNGSKLTGIHVLPTGTLSITSNDTYDVTNYASAVVNVPNPSTGSLSITSNNTYDVTNYASAVVNVSGASLGGLSEMVDTSVDSKIWAYMLSQMKNGNTVGGTMTLASNFTTTETLLLSTGLTTLHGFMFVATDHDIKTTIGSGNSNIMVIINIYDWEGTKFSGVGCSQNAVWSGNVNMEESVQNISGNKAFINGALRFDGGDIYYTARYNNNNAYQFIRSGTQYEWLAW